MKKLCYLIIGLVMISLNSCDTTEPELLDYHNKILFTSRYSGNEQLYMMNPDGTDIVQLTSGEYWHNYGRWSPDAQKIVCNTEEGSTTAGLEMTVMNSDGRNRILLGYGNQMCWYPDGRKIIFTYSQSVEIGIYDLKLYSVDSDGRNRKIISEKYAGGQTFSPDGSKMILPFKQDSLFGIIILDYPEFNNPIYIYVGSTGAYDLNWSPNENEILFSRREISTEPNNIFIMKTDGSNIRRITNNISNMTYKFPHFSPDGERIIFLANTLDGTQKWYLYMVNKDGTDLHKIIDDDSVTSCDWSK